MLIQKNRLPKPRFILLAVVLALLAACQPLNGATPSSALTTTAELTPATATAATPRASATFNATIPASAQPHLQVDPKDLEKLQIRFWHPWSGEAADTMRSLVNKFNQSNQWKIFVSVDAPGSSTMLYEQVADSLETAQQPNVVAASIEQILTWRETSRAVLSLNDYIEDSQWGFTDQEAAGFPKVFWQQDRQDDRQLAIPAQRSTMVMFYNQSWAQSLGFSAPPTTLQEFRTQACAAAAQNNQSTGGWIINTDPIALVSWMWAFQVNEPSKIGSPEYKLDTAAVNEMFQYLRQLYDGSCAWTSRNPTPYEYFATRQALFYTGWLQDIPLQSKTNQRLESEDEWTVIPFPNQAQKPPVITSGTSLAILAASPEEQLASWLFIKWLVQPENLAELIKVDGGWPGSIAAVDLLDDYRNQNPQWSQSLAWIPIAEPAPREPAWRTIRKIYQDVTWQVFRTDTQAEQIPTYLEQADKTIPEVLNYTP